MTKIAPIVKPKQLWGSMVPLMAAVDPVLVITDAALLLTGLGKHMAMYPVVAVSVVAI